MSKQNKTFTLYRILTCKESPETSPNPESGQAILDREICTLTCTLSYTLMKTLDRPVLRLESRDFPGSASTGRTLVKKSQKQLLLATQECCLEVSAVGRRSLPRTLEIGIHRVADCWCSSGGFLGLQLVSGLLSVWRVLRFLVGLFGISTCPRRPLSLSFRVAGVV